MKKSKKFFSDGSDAVSCCCYRDFPIGRLYLTAGKEALKGVYFTLPEEGVRWEHSPILELAVCWLDKYFQNIPVSPFTLPLAPQGTVFQHKVWDILLQIPYGKTMTYGEIAKMISPEMSPRAVGNAVGANPIPIIIPCHRVIARNGPGGYSGGSLAQKRQLLAVEKIILPF